MPRSAGAPVLTMSTEVLADVELTLLGVLPTGRQIGGDLTGPTGAAGTGAAAGATSVTVGADVVEAVRATGELVLVDEEQTPLAALHDATVVLGPDGTATASGVLRRERHRESGPEGTSRLGPDDLRERWSGVLVLGRPVTDKDHVAPGRPDAPLLILVPNDPDATDCVPVATMVALGRRLADRVGGAQVRTAAVRWRDAAGDAALADHLSQALGHVPCVVLRAGADDAASAAWASARQHLVAAVDRTPVPGLAAGDDIVLRRWLPPRPERGVTIMFTGLSGSGKSTLSRAVRDRLVQDTERTVSLLDGDVVRQLLSSGLRFDRESRIMNVRRIGYVATEVTRHGGIALCAPIAPYASMRADMRRRVSEVGDFLLVYVSTPLAECERRDLKGLYAAARAGRIKEFTGISDPYDEPLDADLVIDTTTTSIEEGTRRVMDLLTAGGWLAGDSHGH